MEFTMKEELHTLLKSLFYNEEQLLQDVSEHLSDDVRWPLSQFQEELWNYLKNSIISADEPQSVCKFLSILKTRIEELRMASSAEYSRPIGDHFCDINYKQIDGVFIYGLNELKEKAINLQKDSEKLKKEWIHNGDPKINFQQLQHLNLEIEKVKYRLYTIISYCRIDSSYEDSRSLLLEALCAIYKSGVLELNSIYLSLFCASEETLLQFCLREVDSLSEQLAQCPKILLKKYEPFYSVKNLKCLRKEAAMKGMCHCYIFFSVLLKAYEKWKLPENLSDDFAWLYPFYLLLFLHWWTKQENKQYLCVIFETILKNCMEFEPLISVERGSYSNKRLCNVDSLINILQDHYVLIDCCTDISLNKPYQWFLNILKTKSKNLSLDRRALSCTSDDSSDFDTEDLSVNDKYRNVFESKKVFKSSDIILGDYNPTKNVMPDRNDADLSEDMMLEDLNGHETSEDRSVVKEKNLTFGNIKEACISTYMGYSVLLYTYQLIFIGIKMDHILSEKRETYGNISEEELHLCNLFYMDNVSELWITVKQKLNEINLPQFRFEIIETLFSLLYTKCTQTSDNGKLDFWIDSESHSKLYGKERLDSFKAVVSSTPLDSTNEFPKKGSYNNYSFRSNLLEVDDFKSVFKKEYRNEEEEEVISYPEKIKDNYIFSDEPSSPPSLTSKVSSLPRLTLLISTKYKASVTSCNRDFLWCSCNFNTLVAWDVLCLLEDSSSKEVSPVDIKTDSQLSLDQSYTRDDFETSRQSLGFRLEDFRHRNIALPFIKCWSESIKLDITHLCPKIIILGFMLKSRTINQDVAAVLRDVVKDLSVPASPKQNPELLNQFSSIINNIKFRTDFQNTPILEGDSISSLENRIVNARKETIRKELSKSMMSQFSSQLNSSVLSGKVTGRTLFAVPKTKNLATLLSTLCPSNIKDFKTFESDLEALISSTNNEECDFVDSMKDKILMLMQCIKPCEMYFNSDNIDECKFHYLSIIAYYVKMLTSVDLKYFAISYLFGKYQYVELLKDIVGKYSVYHKFPSLNFESEICAILDCICSPYDDQWEDTEGSEDISIANEELDIAALARFGCSFMDEVYVLNANKLVCVKPVCGSDVVKDLLSSLLHCLLDINTEFGEKFEISHNILPFYLENSDVRMVLLKCSEILSADLTKLVTEDRLVFFINLANLMFLHAVLLNCLIFKDVSGKVGLFADSKMEQLIAMKKVGYIVGQLGYLSLFDVLYKILKQPLVYDNQNGSYNSALALIDSNLTLDDFEELEGLNPLILFAVNQGFSPSPKINVFNSATFNKDLNNAAMEYLKYCAHVPDILENPVIISYLSRHPLGWTEAVESLQKIAEKSDAFWSNSLLHKLKNLNSPSNNLSFTLNVMLIDYYSYNTVNDANEEEIYKAFDQSKDKCSTPIYVPESCLSYIKSCCPNLMNLFETENIDIRELIENTAEDGKEYTNESISINPESRSLYSLPSNCKIYYPRVRSKAKPESCSKDMYEHEFPFEFVFSAIIKAIGRYLSFISQEDFEERNINSSTNMLKIVSFLSEIPDYVVGGHYALSFIRDNVMAYLSSCLVSSAVPEPWSFAYKIKCSTRRFEVMKKNIRNWPIDASLSYLQFMKTEKGLTSSQSNFVETKIQQLDVYSEIMSLEDLNFETCAVVVKLSLESPHELLVPLVQRGHITLALRWMDVHEYRKRFQVQYTKLALHQVLQTLDPDLQEAKSLLDDVEEDKLELMVRELLANIIEHNSRKFLISYIMKKGGFSNLDLVTLKQELMGLVLVEDVAPISANKAQLCPLISRPNLIIEQWIMNLKLDWLDKGIQLISSLLDSSVCKDVASGEKDPDYGVDDTHVDCLCWEHYHQLIENYATKALDLSGSRLTQKVMNQEEENLFVIPTKVPKQSDWQENSSVTICPVCKISVFSLICRRHHCRRCGRVVCGDCSLNRLIVQGYGEEPVRVCQVCYETISDSSCSRSSNEIEDIPDDISIDSLETGWYLTTEPFHNEHLREEFSYEYAPSGNACHALFTRHKDDRQAALCILKLCHKVFQAVVESLLGPGEDRRVLLKIIHTLISSAKVRFGKLMNTEGIALCEYYAQWVNRIQLLLDANCISLLSSDTLANMLCVVELQNLRLSGDKCDYQSIYKRLEQERRYLRILSDKLVKKESWDLALDISTKEGFEKSGIWGASALSSLKAKDFKTSRELFSKILSQIKDKNSDNKITLLDEIITILENPEFQIEEKDKELEQEQELEQDVRDFTGPVVANDNSHEYKISTLNKNECGYYLERYGSHRYYLQFFVRHNLFKEALKYCIEKRLEEKIFTEEVILPSFSKGIFSRLWSDILQVDPEQLWSSSMVFRSCKYLDKMGYLHCLLEVQKTLSDKVRVFWTLIKLYTQGAESYTELMQRGSYLSEAISNLNAYLELPNQISTNSTPKTLTQLNHIRLHSSNNNVIFHLKLANMQENITKYLAGLEDSGHNFKSEIKILRDNLRKRFMDTGSVYKPSYRIRKFLHEVPTIFEKDNRLALVCLILGIRKNSSENLSMVHQLVESKSVNANDLLSITVQFLINSEKMQNLSMAIENVLNWKIIPDCEIKNLIWTPLRANLIPVPEHIVKEVVRFLPSWQDRMEVFMDAGLLKLAYSQIEDADAVSEVERLLDAATKKQDKIVINYCSKWLLCYKKRTRKNRCKVIQKC